MFKLDLGKAEKPEIKLPTSAGSWKKQMSSRKTSTSALLTMPKLLRNVRGNLKHLAGFPDSLVGKESTCNARDPGSVPGLGRSPGKGEDYPL